MPLRVGSATRTVRSKRVNRPEAKESAPPVQSTTTYSPGPSMRWLRYSSTAPVLGGEPARPGVGVVPPPPEIVLGERAGGRQPCPARGVCPQRVHGVGAAREQPRL